MKLSMRELLAFSKFASKEKTRPYLNGVNIRAEGDHAIMAATDGHKLIMRRYELEIEERFNVIVPSADLVGIKWKLNDDIGHLSTNVDGTGEKLIRIATSARNFAMVAIDGTYPDVDRVSYENYGIAPAIFRGEDVVAFDAMAKAFDARACIAPNGHFGVKTGTAIVRFWKNEALRDDVYGVVIAVKALPFVTRKPF